MSNRNQHMHVPMSIFACRHSLKYSKNSVPHTIQQRNIVRTESDAPRKCAFL
jgi:hypothetical protein